MHLPLYRTSADGGSLLTRDEDGWPYHNGETDVGFTVVVPCTLITEPRPGRVLQYGHGLFGDRDEVRSGYLAEMAQEQGWILLGMNWTGMSIRDLPYVSLMLVEEPGRFAMIPEGVAQGMVEWVVGGRLLRGAMAEDPALSVESERIIDPELQAFYGNSMGGVLGGGYIGLAPDIDRAVLGVSGMPFSMMLTRSASFAEYLRIMEVMYDDWADISIFLAAAQTLWDPGEAGGWARTVTEAPVSDTPAKSVLMQVGIGDASVPAIAAHVAGRAYGLDLVQPAPRSVWGLQDRPAPFSGSALVEFDYGVEEPIESVPTEEGNGVHDGPRHSAPAQAQLMRFISSGIIEHHCEGVCDPH